MKQILDKLNKLCILFTITENEINDRVFKVILY